MNLGSVASCPLWLLWPWGVAGPEIVLSAASKHGVLLMRLEAGQHDKSSHGPLLMLVKGLGGVHVHGSLKIDVWVAVDRSLQNEKRTSHRGSKADLLSGIASSGWGSMVVRLRLPYTARSGQITYGATSRC